MCAPPRADYNDPSEGCTICPDSNVSALMPLIIAGGAVLLISVLSSCCHLISRRLAKRKKSLPSLVRLFELQEAAQDKVTDLEDWVDRQKTKIRIMITLYQILGSFSGTFSVRYPPLFTTILKYAAIFELDIFTLIPVDCFSVTSFHARLRSKTLGIGLLVVLLYTLHRITGTSRCKNQPLSDKMFNYMLTLLFLTYTGITKVHISRAPRVSHARRV